MENPTRLVKSILLAEDDIDDIYLFKNALEELHMDFQMKIAQNGIKCMELLRKPVLPDYVFLDINLPLMTGFQCLERIRREERLRDLKVIVLSTASTKDVVDLAYEKGADLYIPKGFDFERFKALLGKCFK